jgi:hypothetical protein
MTAMAFVRVPYEHPGFSPAMVSVNHSSLHRCRLGARAAEAVELIGEDLVIIYKLASSQRQKAMTY